MILAAAIGAAALVPGAAQASVQHRFEFSFNGSGSAGALTNVGGEAFTASGNLYVVDVSGQAVDEFQPDGTYTGVRITGSATPAGSFALTFTSGLAVDNSGSVSDPSNGDVYVADTFNGVVDKFTPSGGFLCQITGQGSASGDPAHECSTSAAGVGSVLPTGLAVDASGNVFVADAGNNVVDEFDSAGNYTGHQISDPNINGPGQIALDASGDLYLNNSGGSTIKFDPTGAFAGVVEGTSNCASSVQIKTQSVGVDPTTGHVYVGDNNCQGKQQVAEYDASGTLLGSFGAGQLGQQVAAVTDVAIDPLTGEVYAGDTDFSSLVGEVNVFTADLIFPDATTGQASGVASSSATLNGTVNPDGTTITDCHFDWGTTPAYGQSAACATTPSGSSPVPVSAQISGLQPDTHYYYRLVATNSAGNTSPGSAETFETAGPPTVAVMPANSISAAGATVQAAINPHGFDTTYHFDYGPDTSYGASTASQDAGSGTTNQVAGAQISGLQPGTTYHFRAVATNGQGTVDGPDYTLITAPASCPNAQFRSGPSAQLPNCRAYEQVSPQDKAGQAVSAPRLAVTGDRVAFSSLGVFSGARADVGLVDYMATRGSDGWSTSAIDPTSSLGYPVTVASSPELDFLPDMSKSISNLLVVPSSSDAQTARKAAFYWRNSDGSFVQASPVIQAVNGGPLHPNGNTLNYTYLGASADLSHLVVGTSVPLVASDTAPIVPTRIYEVSGATTSSPVLRLVSADDSGNPVLGCGDGAGLGDGGGGDSVRAVQGNAWFNAVSADGARIFFSALDPASCAAVQLYARTGGSTTTPISNPQPNDECTTTACTTASEGAADFEGASADGSKAFFLSTQQLTNDASQDPLAPSDGKTGQLSCDQTQGANGCNLYVYDFTRPSGHNLVDISAGDTSGLGPRVQGVLASTNKGSRVYFVAQGLLTTHANVLGDVARAGANNLYVYDVDTGRLSFVGLQCGSADPALAGQPGASGQLSGIAQCPGTQYDARFSYGLSGGSSAKATPDGRYLTFTTSAQLTPDDTNSGADVYEYDADTGNLVRVSIGHDGADSNGNDNLDRYLASPKTYPGALAGPAVGAGLQSNPIASDGQTIVFITSSPLQSSDHNGKIDVYEWHQGEVTLISGGRSTHDAAGEFAVSNPVIDPSGQDITFSTDQPLVPQDKDSLVDVYDARIGGGFPATAVPQAICMGDACQGQPSGAPAPPTAASVSFVGPGNATPSGGRGSTPAGKARVLTRVVRGARFTIVVRVPGAGWIAISGAGVHGVRGFAHRAGAYRLGVSLTAQERSLLKRRKLLRLRLRVSYTPPGSVARLVKVRLTVKR